MLSLALALALASPSAGADLAALTKAPPRRVEPHADKPKKIEAPRVPVGVERCEKPLAPPVTLPRGMGETIRYVIDVNGLSVGTIDFKIERRGTYAGQPITEYRSLFKLDSLVSTFLPVEGRAAALVPDVGLSPVIAMNRYKLDKNEFEESQTFGQGGTAVASKRKKNGESKDESRNFPGPVQDFVSGFYYLRALPERAEGCAIIYGNQRAYTVWLKPEGKEKVKTPVGMREADRFAIIYASDRSVKAVQGKLWLGPGPERLPYKAELNGSDRLEARIHLYETGEAPR